MPNQFVDENSELSPVSLYAETKVAVEKALLHSATQREMVSHANAIRNYFWCFAAHAI